LNIHKGSDPFGHEVRKPIEFLNKLAFYEKLGFDGGQFHDDAACRQFTTDRSKRTIDITNAPGTDLIF